MNSDRGQNLNLPVIAVASPISSALPATFNTWGRQEKLHPQFCAWTCVIYLLWFLLLITEESPGLSSRMCCPFILLKNKQKSISLLTYLPPFLPPRCFYVGSPSITFSNRKFWCFLICCISAFHCCVSYCWNHTWQLFPLFPLGHNYATFTWPCREG